MDDKKLIKKLESVIIKILKKEGGASGLKPLKKAIEKLDKPKKFNLVNFLSKMKNVKKHTNSDYILTPINENSFTKLDIKNLVRESIKELKEQAYGNATATTMGAPRTRAVAPAGKDPYTGRVEYPYIVGAKTKNGGVMEQEKNDLISTAEEMYGVAAKEHFGKIHLYPTKKPGDMVNYRTDKYYVIIKDDLKTITNISGPNNQTFLTLGQSLKFEKSELGQFAGVVSFSGEDTIDDPKGIIYILNMVDASVNQEAKNQSAFYTREPGTGGTGIDEDSIRINMEQAPPGGEEGKEGDKKEKKPKVKENPPKYSLEKIGECKAACTDLEIENLEVKVENVELKLKDLVNRRSDAKPSEVEGMEKERKELLLQMKALDDQIEIKEQEKEKLKNPEKQDQKESKIKKNMKANVKQLWNDYANSRINSSLNEKVNHYRKLARRKVLQEGVMNTFFEYFDQGHTNEEIVQLYAEKGVAVPEQFVSKARNTFESQKKINAELEMSERNFKNEASNIVNNPAGDELPPVLDDDKQLASGLFNEQDEKPGDSEKEASDVSALNNEMKNINTEEEFTSVLSKILDRADSISGMSETKVKALLMKSIKEL